MIHNPLKHLFFILIVVFFSSCNWLNNDTVTTLSSNPTFLSLTFTKSDSIPALSTAQFSLTWDVDLKDSVIVNLDSLPYQTKINKVIPKFTFYSTSVSSVFLRDVNNQPIDTILLSGTDTLDFTKVFKIKNIAADKVKDRSYFIKVNVHKVRPELYQWNKVYNQIFSHSVDKQKAVYFNNNFFLYVTSGTTNYLYTSPNAQLWTPKSSSLSNFPTNSNLRELIEFNSKLYLLSNDSKLYSSIDGFTWTIENVTLSDPNFSFQSILYIYNSNLWSIMKSKTGNIYNFATSTDAKTWTLKGQIPVNFPIRDFSSVSFTTRTKLPKVLIAGGYNTNGELLQNVWTTENGNYWLDFSTDNASHGYIAGSSIILYDNQLFLYGGVDKVGKVIQKPYLMSKDDGLSWAVPDSINNRLRQMNISPTKDTTYINYLPRAYQSVITKNNIIYLIGGVNPLESASYSDVWIGKLNRLNFLRQ